MRIFMLASPATIFVSSSPDKKSKLTRPSYQPGARCLLPCSIRIWRRKQWTESTSQRSLRTSSARFCASSTRIEWSLHRVMRNRFSPQPTSIYFPSASQTVKNSSFSVCPPKTASRCWLQRICTTLCTRKGWRLNYSVHVKLEFGRERGGKLWKKLVRMSPVISSRVF